MGQTHHLMKNVIICHQLTNKPNQFINKVNQIVNKVEILEPCRAKHFWMKSSVNSKIINKRSTTILCQSQFHRNRKLRKNPMVIADLPVHMIFSKVKRALLLSPSSNKQTNNLKFKET